MLKNSADIIQSSLINDELLPTLTWAWGMGGPDGSTLLAALSAPTAGRSGPAPDRIVPTAEGGGSGRAAVPPGGLASL